MKVQVCFALVIASLSPFSQLLAGENSCSKVVTESDRQACVQDGNSKRQCRRWVTFRHEALEAIHQMQIVTHLNEMYQSSGFYTDLKKPVSDLLNAASIQMDHRFDWVCSRYRNLDDSIVSREEMKDIRDLTKELKSVKAKILKSAGSPE